MTANILYIHSPVPPDLSPKRQRGLMVFVATNFKLCLDVAAEMEPELHLVTVVMEVRNDANEKALAALVTLYLSDDLVTIADAAAACNVPIKRISAAVGAGQLRGYINPDAPNPRKGRTLVSLAECRRVWGE